MVREITFSPPIPLAFKEDLERRLFYVADEIERFELVLGATGIDSVRIGVARPDANDAALDEKIRSTAERCRSWGPRLSAERVWSRRTGRPIAADTFAQMCDRGMAFQPSRGLIALDETCARLTDYFDAAIAGVVKRGFGAVEYRYPTLIPSAVVMRGGYLRSFPHLLMFVTRLHSDFDVYTSASHAAADQVAELLRHCDDAEFCLPPTMCYHTYAQIAGSTLPVEGRVFTARGKSFRFESKYERNLERLYDFTIREIVFVGTGPAVGHERRRLIRDICELAERWDLGGACETANDPFFVEDEPGHSALAQRLMAFKYELRLDVGDGNTIAVASFNRHNDFFGNAYDIRLSDGTRAQTACAGIGLERLVFAFLCQHGVDEAGWPAEIREGIERLRAFERETGDVAAIRAMRE